MGAEVNIVSLFQGIGYHTKTSVQIREKMLAKIVAIGAKILERTERVLKIREANNLSELQVSELETQHERDKHNGIQRKAYSTFSNSGHSPSIGMGEKQESFIPAGVVAQIVTEKSLLDSEREQILDMSMIVRNLSDTECVSSPTTGEWVTREARHRLSNDALEFLGF